MYLPTKPVAPVRKTFIEKNSKCRDISFYPVMLSAARAEPRDARASRSTPRCSFTPCSVREFSRKSSPFLVSIQLLIAAPTIHEDEHRLQLPAQHPLNKRVHIFASHLN